MPDYKKKKVPVFAKKPRGRVKKNNKTARDTDIKMSPVNEEKTKPQEKNEVRIIKGKKIQRQRFSKAFGVMLLCLVAVIAVLQFVLPVGIAENLGNLIATVGTGSYPIEIYGTETLNSVSKGAYYYVLTDTNISAFSNGGKKIYSEAHGFARPVLKTSETRALIFNQGGNDLTIWNLSGETNTLTSQEPIVTATVARNGNYAVVSESDKYAAVVSVYDKKDKLLYEWYSANDMVNNVLLSPNGKKMAVSTVNATGGVLKSKISVFEYDSANAVFSAEYSGEVAYSLEGSKKGFFVLKESGYDFYNWSEFNKSEYSTEYKLAFSRKFNSGILLVFNRSSNKTDNRIVFVSNKGEKLFEFAFNGLIGDIAFYNNHIYCISDTNIYMLDKTGKQIASAKCDYGVVRMVITSKQKAAVITNGDITLCDIK